MSLSFGATCSIATLWQAIEDCFPPCTRFVELQTTATLKLFVDQDSNVYDMAEGECLGTRLVPSDCVMTHRWALSGRVLVAVDRQHMLYAVRLADNKVFLVL